MSPKSSYRVFETDRFRRDLEEISPSGRAFIEGKLAGYVYPQLKVEPHFGPNIKRLKGWAPSTWRYRIGDWRFFYEIDDKAKILFMTAASHRKESYR